MSSVGRKMIGLITGNKQHFILGHFIVKLALLCFRLLHVRFESSISCVNDFPKSVKEMARDLNNLVRTVFIVMIQAVVSRQGKFDV